MSAELENQAAFEATVLGFLYRQFTRPKKLPAGTELTGKVAVVTGSNVGLGFQASRQLLELGLDHLVMAVRSRAKGDATAVQLRNEFPASTIVVWTVDLESYDSVCAFAERCATLRRLDIAILNAGLLKPSFTIVPATEHELTLQVNYLSTALMAILLLPILKASRVEHSSRPPVLTIVGSDLMYTAEIEAGGPVLQRLEKPELYNQFSWYRTSKLMLTFFVTKLGDLVDPGHVLVNMVNPGMTKDTDFFREFSSILVKLVAVGQWLFARPVDVAASTYVDAVVARGKESHGSFISDWEIKPYPKICYTPEGEALMERLWEETMEELNFAGAAKIIENLRDLPNQGPPGAKLQSKAMV